MENLSSRALEIIEDLLEQGFWPEQIKSAMEDGEYLATTSITQEEAEEVEQWASSGVSVKCAIEYQDMVHNALYTKEHWAHSEKEANSSGYSEVETNGNLYHFRILTGLSL